MAKLSASDGGALAAPRSRGRAFAAAGAAAGLALVALAVSWRVNNPSYPELAGRWRVAEAVNIGYKSSWYIFQGLDFDIDARGLMADRNGSAFSFLIVDAGCGPGCYGLIDHWNAIGHTNLLRMERAEAPQTWRVRIADNSYFVIARSGS